MKKRFYVSCIDIIMSGWGMAKYKTNRLVFVCDTEAQMYKVQDNLLKRKDMIDVSLHFSSMPKFDSEDYVQYKAKKHIPTFFK